MWSIHRRCRDQNAEGIQRDRTGKTMPIPDRLGRTSWLLCYACDPSSVQIKWTTVEHVKPTTHCKEVNDYVSADA